MTDLSQSKQEDVTIAMGCMVKDEERRIHVTMQSVLPFCKTFIIYDTGSTDNTIPIIQAFCEKHNISLHLKQGTFVNFRDSRNVLLELAEEIIGLDYILLLDSNDEVQPTNPSSDIGPDIIDYCKKHRYTNFNGFLCHQTWLNEDKSTVSYFNVRLIKAYRNWRYKCPVHEYIMTPDIQVVVKEEDRPPFTIFQDRKEDQFKSVKRFKRDREILMAEHETNPKDARVVFYLAQTLANLEEFDLACYFYKLRTQMGDFWEEVYHSYERLGNLYGLLNHPWETIFVTYMKAFEVCKRVEPLLRIVTHYVKKEDWHCAFVFAQLACGLEYPKQCILFVNTRAYVFERWFMLGICAFYVKEYAVGHAACLKALEAGIDTDSVKKNLDFYIKAMAQQTTQTDGPGKEEKAPIVPTPPAKGNGNANGRRKGRR